MNPFFQNQTRKKFYLRLLSQTPSLGIPAQKRKPPKTSLQTVFRYVLAPTVGGFLSWLLISALRSGQKRLYFLSRDGYLFYRGAKLLCSLLHLPIECRYLYGSRYALRFPLLHQNKASALSFLFGETQGLTAHMIFRRAKLTPLQEKAVLKRLSLPFSPFLPLSPSQRKLLYRRLKNCGLFFACLNRHSTRAFAALSGYLRKEGLLDDVSFAVVDSGWNGSVQKDLWEILRLLGRKRPVYGYYFGLYRIPKGVSHAFYHSYLFGPENGFWKKVWFGHNLFEAIFTAPYGITLGYRKGGGGFVPYGKAVSPKKAAFLKTAGEEIDAYLRLFARYHALCPARIPKERKTIAALLFLLCFFPTHSEAKQLGALSFSEGILDEKSRPLAPKLSKKELKSGYLIPSIRKRAGLFSYPFKESLWYPGSAAICQRPVFKHLFHYALFRTARQLRLGLQARLESRGDPS